MVDLADFINRIGFAATVAIMLVVGMVSVIRWFKPWGEKLFQSHLDFTAAIAATQSKQATTQSDTCRLLSEIHGEVHNGKKAMGHLADAVHESSPDEHRENVRRYTQKVHDALNEKT